MPEAAGETPARLFHCSFCAKAQTDVKTLISGPGVFICNECVDLCTSINAAQPTPLEPASILTPNTAPTEQLMNVMKGYNTAVERMDQAMQDVADILRERDVSWAAIGETLGVSRQAAWKRFG